MQARQSDVVAVAMILRSSSVTGRLLFVTGFEGGVERDNSSPFRITQPLGVTNATDLVLHVDKGDGCNVSLDLEI